MISYVTKSFDQLTLNELYDIMALRQEVFVVEQDCPYLDADGKDQDSYHCLGYIDGQLEAYTRICPPGISYDTYVSIGRVIVSQRIRSSGEGARLMMYSLEECKRLFPSYDNKISAQCHLTGFYQSLGYTEVGESYLEDDIPHIAMIRIKD